MGGQPEPCVRRTRARIACDLPRAAHRAGSGARVRGHTPGSVSAITGMSRYQVRLEGRADHAGTIRWGSDATPWLARPSSFWPSNACRGPAAVWAPSAACGSSRMRRTWCPAPSSCRQRCAVSTLRSWNRTRRRFPDDVRLVAAQRGLVAAIGEVSRKAPGCRRRTRAGRAGGRRGGAGQPVKRLPSWPATMPNQIAKIAPVGMLLCPVEAVEATVPRNGPTSRTPRSAPARSAKPFYALTRHCHVPEEVRRRIPRSADMRDPSTRRLARSGAASEPALCFSNTLPRRPSGPADRCRPACSGR